MALQKIISPVIEYFKRISCICMLLILVIDMQAQRNVVYSDQIASLQVVAGSNWTSMPVINLEGLNHTINISFDELSHEYHRYVYKVQHFESDWTPSQGLFESDYINGFQDGNTIDTVEESFNTNTLYTHYHISIPNDHCQLKISGNYGVTIYDENDDKKPILQAYFMVLESQMNVAMSVLTSTDIDFNHSHQQVEMTVGYGNVDVTDQQNQIRTVVLQNGRWDDARWNVKPQYVMSDGLRWSHCRDFIFNGGNEYRKFETLDVTHTTMGLESVNWDGKEYHAWIWTDEPRPSYLYDESANGSFYIRNSDNADNDFTTDYVWVHFRLKSPRQPGDVFLNGVWTQDAFDPLYKLSYNEQTGIYETKLKLKQGYYSYQYLLQHSDGSMSPVASEGNFFQTENQYQALVYFRGNGERTDRLVGYKQIDYK